MSGAAVGGPGVAVGDGVAVGVAVGADVGVGVALGAVGFADCPGVGDCPTAGDVPPPLGVPPPPEQATNVAVTARYSTIERVTGAQSFRLVRIYGSLNPLATRVALMPVAPEHGPVVAHVLPTAPK